MGYRLHVCKVHKIEYATLSAFNWKKSELVDMLEAFGCDCSGIGEYNENDTFEISVTQFKKALSYLKNFATDTMSLNDEIFESYALDELESLMISAYGRDVFLAKKMTIKEVAKELYDTLKQFHECADINDGYLHFCFF